MTLLRSLVAVNVGIVVLLASALPAVGQSTPRPKTPQPGSGRDNPLEYRFEYDFDYRVGADLGFGLVSQSGKYFSGCGEFTVGSGLNPLVAVSIDRPLTRNLFVEAMVGYMGLSVSSSYNSREQVALMTESAGIRYVDVDFENKGTATFSSVFFLPSFKYYIFKGLFAGVGANVGLLLGKKTQYTKDILSKTVEINDDVMGGLSEVYYPAQESSDPYSKVFPEETRDDASGVAISGVAYVGAEFTLSEKWRLLPRVLYSFPLTTVLPSPEELKLSAYQFVVGVRYELR